MDHAVAPAPDCRYGVDISDDGSLVVAEIVNGRPVPPCRYAAGADGIHALRERIARRSARRRVCIRCRGAAAFEVALNLATFPDGEIMLVAPRAFEAEEHVSLDAPPATPEQRAIRLASRAGRLY